MLTTDVGGVPPYTRRIQRRIGLACADTTIQYNTTIQYKTRWRGGAHTRGKGDINTGGGAYKQHTTFRIRYKQNDGKDDGIDDGMDDGIDDGMDRWREEWRDRWREEWLGG